MRSPIRKPREMAAEKKKIIAYGNGRFVEYDFVNLGTDIGIIGEDMGRKHGENEPDQRNKYNTNHFLAVVRISLGALGLGASRNKRFNLGHEL